MKPGRDLDYIVDTGVVNGNYPLRDYSTRIEDAWKVVEKMQSLGWAVIVDNMHGYLGGWQAHFEKDKTAFACEGDTAAHAICLAAIQAVRSEQE